MTQEQAEEQGRAIRKIMIGAIIMQYGGLEILDTTRGDLKFRVKKVLNAAKELESYFLFHPQSNDHFRSIFKKQFISDEIAMLSELLELVWGIKADDLEEIIKAIRDNVVNETA